MAHNGIARSHRLGKLLRRHRTRHGDGEQIQKAGEPLSTQPVSNAGPDQNPHNDPPAEAAHEDSELELSLKKRQQTAVLESQPDLPTPGTSDPPLDTMAPLPTATSGPGLNQPTASVPFADTTSVAVPTSSLDELPTPSPGLPSLTADTPTVTSAYDATIIPTVSLSLSLDISTSISILIPTTSLINVSNAHLSALIPSANPSSVALSSTSTPLSKPTSAASSSSNLSSSTTSITSTYSTTTSSWSEFPTTSSEATATVDLYGTDGSYPGGGGSGATETGQAPAATPSSSSSGGSLDSVTTKRIIGGVVGGLAGAFFLVALLVFLLRRRKTAMFRPKQGLPTRDGTGGAASEGGSILRSEMVSRRSSRDPLFTASYFAPAFMKRWRQSNLTVRSDDSIITSTTSERGFQKISGRKIPSVLQSGGDGYGGGFDQGSPTISEPSTIIPPGSPVYPRSLISQPPPSMPYGMPLDASYTREADEPGSVVFRPSPARTPVASSTNISMVTVPAATRAIPQGTLSPTMPQRPDVLGRSHPSFDGSRGSRFTESLDGL